MDGLSRGEVFGVLIHSIVEVFFELLKTVSKRLIQKCQVMQADILPFRSQQAFYD